jgi:hypothetical protein
VYGVPLEEHLRVTGRDIALVLEVCVITLIEGGLDEEVSTVQVLLIMLVLFIYNRRNVSQVHTVCALEKKANFKQYHLLLNKQKKQGNSTYINLQI